MSNNEDTKQDLELRYIRRDLESLQTEVRNGFSSITNQINNQTVSRKEFEDKMQNMKDEVKDMRRIMVFVGSAIGLALIGAFMKVILKV